jgi:hypothetical protein
MTSFYTKNVPVPERVLRVLIALAVVALALLKLPSPWSYVVAIMSVGLSVTGFVGYCPACAMVGRRL